MSQRMITVDVFFDLHSYWHVGTGRGGGPSADATAFRDGAGLPCVPGKQVKGLLREAVEAAEIARLYEPPADWSTQWFGTSVERSTRVKDPSADNREQVLESMRFTTRSGTLIVGTASIGATRDDANAWSRWAAQNPVAASELYRSFSSTRLRDDGVAEDSTLRTVEVVVPMKLRAEVSGPDDAWPERLARALCFVDAVGGHRTRGFGRATVTLERRR